MMPLRLWEFLIGYGVATYLTTHGNIKYFSLRWLGLIAIVVLIAIPSFGIDGEAIGFMHGHPGLFAFVVSLATGIILAFGMPKFIETSKLGTTFEVLGKYSYSIYLVHFPIIVLFLYQPFSGTILKVDSVTQTALLLISISIFSILMYRYIENPSRHSKKVISSLFMTIFFIFVMIFIGKKIQEWKYSPIEQKIFYAWEDRASYRCGKLIRILEPTAISCEITADIIQTEKKIFLVGNSHADTIKATFANIAEKSNVSVRFVVANTPLMKGSPLYPEDIVREAEKHDIDVIVLHYSPHAIKVKTIQTLVDLSTKKHIKVDFIMPVPVWEKHIPKVLYAHLEHNTTLPKQTQKEYQKVNRDFYNKLSSIKNLSLYRVDDVLCQTNCHYQDNMGNLYYFDEGHLTLTGAQKLEDIFQMIIEKI
jgi:hypothetical protein